MLEVSMQSSRESLFYCFLSNSVKITNNKQFYIHPSQFWRTDEIYLHVKLSYILVSHKIWYEFKKIDINLQLELIFNKSLNLDTQNTRCRADIEAEFEVNLLTRF